MGPSRLFSAIKIPPPIFIILTGCFFYANSLKGAFVSEDLRAIVQNSSIRSLDLAAIWVSFNTRFLTGLSFALNYRVSGLEPFSYHVINLLLHLIAGCLVFVFVFLILKQNQRVALVSALIFLIHPVQPQAVSYISQRSVLLATIWYVLVLIGYGKGRSSGNTGWYGLAMIAMTLGLFSKEMVVTAPMMAMVMERMFLQGGSNVISRRVLMGLSAIALSLGFILWLDRSDSLLNFKHDFLGGSFSWRYALTEMNVLVSYWRLFLLPIHQSHHYFYPLVEGGGGIRVICSTIILIAMLAVAWQLRRREKIISFCIVWYFVTTSVEAISVCFIHGGVMYDHWLYLPMVGLSLLLAYSIERWVRSERVRLIFTVVLILTYGLLTIGRNIVWQSPVSVWKEVVAQDPQEAWPYDVLARAYKWEGNYNQAIEVYKTFFARHIRVDRVTYAEMLVSMSALFALQGMYDQEIEYAREALRFDPSQDQAYNNIGLVLAKQNDFESAKYNFQQAIILNPNNAQARHNLWLLNQRLERQLP